MAERYTALRELLGEVYGDAPTEEELVWWLDRNPTGPSIVAIVDGESAAAFSFSPLRVDGREELGAMSLHNLTVPASRGRGTFSRLEQQAEAAAAETGATVGYSFTTAMATRVFVGRLGWELLDRPRLWARPRLRRRPGREPSAIPPFTDDDAAALAGGGTRVLKDARLLHWRYRESPRVYRRVEGPGGFAILGAWRRGRVRATTICELAGGARVLRSAARASEGQVVLGLPGRGRRLAYLAAGFVPTPWRLRLIGKRLDGGPPLPRRWRLDLGDIDIF